MFIFGFPENTVMDILAVSQGKDRTWKYGGIADLWMLGAAANSESDVGKNPLLCISQVDSAAWREQSEILEDASHLSLSSDGNIRV